MMINNILYKLKKDILPFKSSIVAVVISVVASVGVAIVSDTGKGIIHNEMNSMGLNGLAAVMYNTSGENITDLNFYKDISVMEDTEYITPVIVDSAKIEFANGKTLEVMSWGINNQASNVVNLEIVSGRMITAEDIENNARVCIVDENIAQKIYKRNNICGKNISVDISGTSTDFEIIGTVKKGSSILNNLTGSVVPNFIYIPYSTLKNISAKSSFDQIIFTSADTEQSAGEFKSRLNDINYKYRNKTVKLTNLSNQKEQVTNIVDTAFTALFLVSCVAVLVCSISVASGVNTAVLSRQKDIGIKMSIGANRFNITFEFLRSAIISCFLGIIIAVFLVFIIIGLLNLFMDFNIKTDYFLIVLSISVTILLTTVFSFLPSWKAANMPPIKALNRE